MKFLPIELRYKIGQHLEVIEREALKLRPRKFSLQRIQALEDRLQAAQTLLKVASRVVQRDHRLIIDLSLLHDDHSGLDCYSHLYQLQRDSQGNVRVLAFMCSDYSRFGVIWDSRWLEKLSNSN